MPVMVSYRTVFLVILIGYLIHWIPERMKNWCRNIFSASPVPVMGLAVVVAVFLMYQAMSADMQPFIYFQF